MNQLVNGTIDVRVSSAQLGLKQLEHDCPFLDQLCRKSESCIVTFTVALISSQSRIKLCLTAKVYHNLQAFLFCVMIIQVLFAFQMRCGMNELDHRILSLLKQLRKRPEWDSAMPVYFCFLSKAVFPVEDSLFPLRAI